VAEIVFLSILISARSEAAVIRYQTKCVIFSSFVQQGLDFISPKLPSVQRTSINYVLYHRITSPISKTV
jgi:hypothetical protein